MSTGQVTAPGGGHTDIALRPPPADYQQQRSREEIELAESLLDHRHGPRDATRHFAHDSASTLQQSQQQHQPPQHQPQQQQHYQHPLPQAQDDRRPADPPRLHQNPDFTPSNYQSSYAMHPHPNAPPHSAPRTPTPGAQPAQNPPNGQYCSNCGTTKTPLWRRSQLGQTICNACGLYEKARNTARPPNLKRPPSYAPAYSAGSGNEQDPATAAPSNTYVPAQSQPCQGTCPGDGKCNGTGGTAACDGCPAFNNRVSKTAQLALNHARRPDTTGDAAAGDHAQDPTSIAPDAENVVIACQNCHTTTTPLWRRDMDGHTICNACGLYYKLHGQHRPVEMKKSFIKRRKRVAPALAGQDVQHVSNNAASASEMSTSPEAAAAYYYPPAAQQDTWAQRHHARNPVEPRPSIDPTLDRGHYPPPVDFTSYNSRPPASAAPTTSHQNDTLQQAHAALASPKRRHQSLAAQDHQSSAPHDEDPPATSSSRREHATTSPPNNDDEQSRIQKRINREQLKEKMRRMKEEMKALGDSDDDA